jgi:hypothetical protein
MWHEKTMMKSLNSREEQKAKREQEIFLQFANVANLAGGSVVSERHLNQTSVA